MALEPRQLGATISLASGSFTEGGNQVKLPKGLRMAAYLEHAGGLSDGTLDLTIYGMTRSLMNRLSTLGMQINLVPKNPITLMAGTDGKMTTAFNGYIIAAYADFNASPDVAFHISAHTLAAYSAAPAEASSFQGSADVATIMAGLATKMGLRFENNGVQTKLSNPYFSGSLRQQAQACVKAAGISWNSGELGVLAIWPKNGSRGGRIPVIAPPPKGSMIGYPTYTAYGIMIRNLYDPTIGFGQKVSVESSVLTTGEWQVYGLSHRLESQTPRGKWETTMLAYNPKHPTPVK
jgi:hypothetical protein